MSVLSYKNSTCTTRGGINQTWLARCQLMTYNSFKYSDFNAHVISTRTLKFWFDRYFTQFYVKNLNAPYQVAFAAPIGKEQSRISFKSGMKKKKWSWQFQTHIYP